jgi:hypothetical protein
MISLMSADPQDTLFGWSNQEGEFGKIRGTQWREDKWIHGFGG